MHKKLNLRAARILESKISKIKNLISKLRSETSFLVTSSVNIGREIKEEFRWKKTFLHIKCEGVLYKTVHLKFISVLVATILFDKQPDSNKRFSSRPVVRLARGC